MTPYYETELGTLYNGDCLEVLSDLESDTVQCVVTSPPYWGLRDYGVGGQLGLEKTPKKYIEKMVAVFREVRRVLRGDGTLWLNMGDSYYNYRPGAGQSLVKQTIARTGQDLPEICLRRGNRQDGLKEKDLCGIPWRLALALQADGWYLRCDIIWSKPNPMPESVTDRPTKAHEYVFLMSKNARYYYDADAVREAHTRDWSNETMGGALKPASEWTVEAKTPTAHKRMDKPPQLNPAGRNRRSVWEIATQPFPEAHFATFPEKLVIPCIKAGTKKNDIVLDPFAGSGTVPHVCEKYGRGWIGIEISKDYCDIAVSRIKRETAQLKLRV